MLGVIDAGKQIKRWRNETHSKRDIAYVCAHWYNFKSTSSFLTNVE